MNLMYPENHTSQSTNKTAANDGQLKLTIHYRWTISIFQCEYWKCNKKFWMRGVEGDVSSA